ncbi:MAG: hypothetical protein PHE48_00510 [Candidatus Daviesbacteria bacterium]|nr:hypothetical protein [Candidatus Daviesbacteria bacterium]
MGIENIGEESQEHLVGSEDHISTDILGRNHIYCSRYWILTDNDGNRFMVVRLLNGRRETFDLDEIPVSCNYLARRRFCFFPDTLVDPLISSPAHLMDQWEWVKLEKLPYPYSLIDQN